MATTADSDMVSERVLARSFTGIALPKDARVKALAIIKHAFVGDMLTPRGDADRSAKLEAIYDRRDAQLLALLQSRADSARYRENSAPLRPRATKTLK